MPVSLGDTIVIQTSDLDAKKDVPLEVAWQQSFKDVTEKYIQTTFTVAKANDPSGKTGADTQGVIFIQSSMLDAFKKKHVANAADITVVVDKTFVYGQKSKDGTGRWLVFHNKEHKPYQHRFINASIVKGGLEQAAKIAKALGFESGDTLMKTFSKYLGDPLREF